MILVTVAMAVVIIVVALTLIALDHWAESNDDDPHNSEYDSVQEEVAMRVLRTGRMHVANRRDDGSWEIKEV